MKNKNSIYYAQKALSQIPRLLGNQDRNPFSPTYGCFHRDYWLDKTSDFPDAVRQFGTHALALAYKFDFPGTIYRAHPKIRDWAVAGMLYWTRIQHRDGSFDEFYPYERGWVGPSAFTTYAVVEAFCLLQDEISDQDADKILNAIRSAAYFIGRGETEKDDLANHHAMACLAVWKAFELLKDPQLETCYHRLWQGFLKYHNEREGWSREYDGIDPGYLSATVSFLAKIYQTRADAQILQVLKQSIQCCSYFVYPNGFYAGSMGSRNTLHFYPHGFEILADKVPLAGAVADHMLTALGQNKLVPPEIMSDRYVFYRVPEYLLAYLDCSSRSRKPAKLPFEQKAFCQYFNDSRIFASVYKNYYILANLAKGGVIKVFNKNSAKILLNDCGIVALLQNGKIATTQWIDPALECQVRNNGWQVRGRMSLVPSGKLFTPLKNIIFRLIMITFGRIPFLAHFIKGRIRTMLILDQKHIPILFQRSFEFSEDMVQVTDTLRNEQRLPIKRLSIGGEFYTRYVPQSRYFQSQELDIESIAAPAKILNAEKIQIHRTINLKNGKVTVRYD